MVNSSARLRERYPGQYDPTGEARRSDQIDEIAPLARARQTTGVTPIAKPGKAGRVGKLCR